MSASFYWAPCVEKRRIPAGTSTEYAALKRVFGEQPWRLSDSNLETLDAMAAVASKASLFEHIADAIRQHDEIEVPAEW